MKKRTLSFLIILFLLCHILGGVAAADAPTLPDDTLTPAPLLKESGEAGREALSELEIATLMAEAPLSMDAEVLEEAPSLTAPYGAGKLRASAAEAALKRLNLMRRLAGLPAVVLDETLNEAAQYGAVLLASSDFSHTPKKPEGMDDAFYNRALAATTSSNLAGGVPLTKAVDLFMEDSDAINLPKLGHRRWQLNPLLGKVGFGYVYDDPADNTPQEGNVADPLYNYRHYVTEQVFDASGKAVDYEFIGWPATGTFPTNVFAPQSAWSISLNPEKYQAPVQEAITVTLTDGDKEWVFEGNKEYAVTDPLYFNVENSPYGVANCIIFRPDVTAAYEGTWQVEVTGLKDLSGATVSFAYEVTFFDANAYITNETHVCTVKRFKDLKHTAWYHDAVAYAVDHALMNGTANDKFEPNANLTRAMIVQVLYNREGKPQSGESPFTDVKPTKWYNDAIAWSAANDIVKGFEDSTFRPDAPITRQQMATVLFRYAEYKGYDVTGRGDLSKFTDGDKTAAWAKAAVEWAVASGLMQGDEKGRFDPEGTATRAQVATVLMNYCEKIAK